MPNPNRPPIQNEVIRTTGGNVHLRQPMKASEQKRIADKISKKLRKETRIRPQKKMRGGI